MKNKHVYFLMLGILVLLGLGFIGTAVLGDRLLKQESAKLVDLKLQDSLLEQQQIALTQAIKDIETYSEIESIAKTVVPQDKDQAKAVREITKLAADNNIRLSSITFPASTLGEAPPKTAVVPSENSDAPAAPAAPAAPSISQVKPAVGIPGVYTLELTIQQDTSNPTNYPDFINFLKDLERNRRTAHVTGVSVSPIPNDRSQITFTLTVILYIKP